MFNLTSFKFINAIINQENNSAVGSPVAKYSRVLQYLGLAILGLGLATTLYYGLTKQEGWELIALSLGLMELLAVGLLLAYYNVRYLMDDEGFEYRDCLRRKSYYRYVDGVVIKVNPTETYVKFNDRTFELSFVLINQQSILERINNK
jgi:hypothetical protein